MATQTTTSASRRTHLNAPAARAAIAAGLATLAIVLVAATTDPSGLLAPVGGRGLPLVGAGGVYRWAPFVVGLPVLLAGVVMSAHTVARAGRPAARARWVFLVVWAGAVGAATVAAAATGVAAALPMVGEHLSLGAAVRFAFATAGFAGLKFLVVGPLVALAAALAYRVGSRRAAAAEPAVVGEGQRADGAAPPVASAPAAVRTAPAGATRLSTVVALLVASLAAVTFAATSWRGGPVGYAFGGTLVAPTAAGSALGTLAGMVVFVGAFALAVRAAHRRLGARPGAVQVAAAAWFAAVVAGLALGVVGALVSSRPGAQPLADAGPDSWWIATGFITVATAVGYGAAVGLLVAVGAGLAWRWRSRLPRLAPRGRLAVASGLAALLVVVPLVAGTPAAAGPPAAVPQPATGGMERLQVLAAEEPGALPVIGDATGRQVLLRGVNVNNLIDYYLRDPEVPATGELTDDDFAQIAALGFNVVRLGMSWSRLEPARGEIDASYLDQVEKAVASAKAHGVYVVLDMHEDAWGNALAKPDQECGGGTTPTTGWDGAPEWATITDGTLHCQFMARDLAPAVATAFSNLYTDRDGIQTELVRTWAAVAERFADEPAVAGYDLLNEPGIGATPPISSGLLLGRYYDAAISAIRDAETAAGGFQHLVFFEPSVLWSGLAFDVTPPPGFTDDTQLVFAPHPYSESISMDQSFGLTIASIERNLDTSRRAALGYGAALWAGEWGWFGDPEDDAAKVGRMLDAQDRLGIGGAFWVWRQGCGSPETGADAERSGNLVSVDCATGELSPPPAAFATHLSRAYPRAVPGRLVSLTSGTGGRDLELAGRADEGSGSCVLEVWVPGEASPHVEAQGVADVRATAVPGGWSVTGCASGAYALSVRA